ncbi:MAG: HAD-IA family hydrolase [Ruminiclostridium sp.]|nr:HAD-IA family hydrolase [Ruminiclostridium sp.]
MKVIFIDIDNTLLSFSEYVKHTMQTGFEHFGLMRYEPYMYDIFTEENNKLWHRIEQGTLVFSELEKVRWNIIFARLGIGFDGTVFEKYFRRALYDSAIPMPYADEMLRYLSGKYTLCAASNGPYEQQVHRLEVAGMKRYFDYIFISEKLGASKPSEEFFKRAFAELNSGREEVIMPADTIIIGDSLTSDIDGGRNYGMKTCFYNVGGVQSDSIKADYVIDELNEVEGIL